jgi:acylphosphatase
MSIDSGEVAIHAVIRGRVQGVWYRGWTVERAGRLGLSGWVRNRSNGTVEAVFAGPADAVEEMLAACWSGPPLALVREVERSDWSGPVPEGFEQRPSA